MSGRPVAGGLSEDTWLLASEQRILTMNSTVKCQSKSKHKVSDVKSKRSNDCNDNNDTTCSELILMKPLETANSRSHEHPASTKSKQTNQLSELLYGKYVDSETF